MGYNIFGFAIKDMGNVKEVYTNTNLYKHMMLLLNDLENTEGIVNLSCGDCGWYWYCVPVSKMKKYPDLKKKIEYIASVIEKLVPSLFETFDWMPQSNRYNKGYVTISYDEVDED